LCSSSTSSSVSRTKSVPLTREINRERFGWLVLVLASGRCEREERERKTGRGRMWWGEKLAREPRTRTFLQRFAAWIRSDHAGSHGLDLCLAHTELAQYCLPPVVIPVSLRTVHRPRLSQVRSPCRVPLAPAATGSPEQPRALPAARIGTGRDEARGEQGSVGVRAAGAARGRGVSGRRPLRILGRLPLLGRRHDLR
jgi:hypothetical protein